MNITINNQKFEKTSEILSEEAVWYKGSWYKPVKKPLFTTEDGVDIYEGIDSYYCHVSLDTWEIEESKSSQKGISGSLKSSQYKYFSTREKAEEYIIKNKPKYEILSFKSSANSYTFRFKNKYGFFPLGNLYNPENRFNEFSEKELLGDTWYEIHSVKRISDGEIFTLEDECITTDNKVFKIKEFLIDDLTKSGISVISNHAICGEFKNVCLSSIRKHLPKLTFGGYECSFNIMNTQNILGTYIAVTCKGTTGTHHEIQNILDYYEKPVNFGIVKLYKNYPLSENVTIGCLQGKLQELKDIYNHCLNLLK